MGSYLFSKLKKNIINKGKTLSLAWFICPNGLVGKFVSNYLVGMYICLFTMFYVIG